MNLVNVAMMVLCAVGMSACGSKGGTAAALNAVTPGLTTGGDVTTPVVAPVEQDVDVIVYTLSTTFLPTGLTGLYHTDITEVANCLTYNSQQFCWDNGAQVYPATTYNNVDVGPYGYEALSQGSGGQLTSTYASPMLVTQYTNINRTVINEVVATGTAVTTACTVDEANTTLTCPTFTVDLNQ